VQDNRSRIFAHRGIWNEAPQNSLIALTRAADEGFAVETDIRLVAGKVVLSHDPTYLDQANTLSEVLPGVTPFALNIKEDGLIPYLDINILNESNCFFFDGSLPELYKYKKAGFLTACRLSEYESELPWASQVVWLDAFVDEWWINSDKLKRLTENALVVVVSPELHGRDKLRAWEEISREFQSGNPNIGVCTDHPEEFEAIL
jgi:glycerophosphoryl diester phosphodiesterase